MSALRRAANAAFLCCLATLCRAETQSSESVLAGINVQSMQGADGTSVDAGWVRSSERSIVSAGAAVANIGSNQWTLFKATAAQNRESRPALSGSVDIGPGSNGSDRFTFVKLALGVSAPLARRWRVSGETTYVDVKPIAGQILAVAGTLTGRNGLAIRLQASDSVSGSLDERGTLARFDYRSKPPFVMGGISTATTNNRFALGASRVDEQVTRLRNAFFGLSFPLRRKALTVALEVGKVGEARRSGVSFFVKSPLEGE